MSIVKRIDEKRAEKKKADDKLACVKCGHRVESLDDWPVAFDLPKQSGLPKGAQDSGLRVCPESKCGAIQPHTVMDDDVPEVEDYGIFIPKAVLDKAIELTEDLECSDSDAFFNPLTAIFRSVQKQMKEKYGNSISALFPADVEINEAAEGEEV